MMTRGKPSRNVFQGMGIGFAFGWKMASQRYLRHASLSVVPNRSEYSRSHFMLCKATLLPSVSLKVAIKPWSPMPVLP